MSYPALFALHLVAVTAFAAGLLMTGLLLPGAARARNAREVARLRRFNLWIVGPALLLLWACGIGMAMQAGWFAMGWIKAKAAAVLILSALHGRQMRTLRRLGAQPVSVGYRAVLGMAALLIAIVALAVAKPF